MLCSVSIFWLSELVFDFVPITTPFLVFRCLLVFQLVLTGKMIAVVEFLKAIETVVDATLNPPVVVWRVGFGTMVARVEAYCTSV